MPQGINANLKYSRKNPQHDLELLKKIGSGTYGEVYHARYIETGAETAVKIVKIDQGDDWEVIQQEVIILQECKHPNIVAYMGSYLSKERLWITMEFCSGGSVQDLYRVNGPLGEEQIALISRDTLKGLSYLHSRQIIHRDIKGANILLTTQGHVKLADFGISAQITETLGKRKSFIGTPYWMAPEVAAVESKGGYDHMCDIWAVGITAIECAEMQPPLYEMHPMKVLYLMTKNNYKAPTLKNKSKWTSKFHQFLKDCLVKNPRRRPTADKLLYNPFCTQFLVSGLLEALVKGTMSQVDEQQEPEQPEPETPEPAKKAGPSRVKSVKNPKKERPDRADRAAKAASIIDQVAIPQPPPRAAPPPPQPGQTEDNNIYDEPWNSVKGLDELLPPPPQEELEEEMFDNMGSDRDDTVKRPLPPPAPLPETGDGTLLSDAVPPSRPPRPISSSGVPPTPPRRGPAPPTAPPPSASPSGVPPPPLPPRNPAKSSPSTPSPAPNRARFFTKIFSGCPLNINCAGVWTHPSREHTYVLLGTEQGLYTLDTASREDPTMIILSSKRVVWLNVYDNMLLTMSGDQPYIYSHNLLLLHEAVKEDDDRQISNRGKRLQATTRLHESKGVKKACAVVNPYTKDYTCCVLTSASLLLYMWRSVKFECVKVLPNPSANPDWNPPLFETIIRADEALPRICVGVHQGENNSLFLELINLNHSGYQLADNRSPVLPVHTLHQIERDTILVGYGSQARFVNIEGREKQSARTKCHLNFSVQANSLVCLEGGLLGFHKNGMEGRSLSTGQVEAEVKDENKVFRLLSSARMIILESRVSKDTVNNSSSNLYVLTSAKQE